MESPMVEVRVIKLDGILPDTHAVKKIFPQATAFKAVDMRKTSADELLRQGTITAHGHDTMVHGRRHHCDLPRPGAVGVYLSFRGLLAEKEGPIVICEEDCHPTELAPLTIEQLLAHQDEFDMAVLGAFAHEGNVGVASCNHAFVTVTDKFFGMHCTLFSTNGRKKLAKLLEGPVDIQIDSYISRLSAAGACKVIVQMYGDALAVQNFNIKRGSTIQNNHLSPTELMLHMHTCLMMVNNMSHETLVTLITGVVLLLALTIQIQRLAVRPKAK